MGVPVKIPNDKSLIISLALQLTHPLPRILHLCNTRVSVLPEVEEFLIML